MKTPRRTLRDLAVFITAISALGLLALTPTAHGFSSGINDPSLAYPDAGMNDEAAADVSIVMRASGDYNFPGPKSAEGHSNTNVTLSLIITARSTNTGAAQTKSGSVRGTLIKTTDTHIDANLNAGEMSHGAEDTRERITTTYDGQVSSATGEDPSPVMHWSESLRRAAVQITLATQWSAPARAFTALFIGNRVTIPVQVTEVLEKTATNQKSKRETDTREGVAGGPIPNASTVDSDFARAVPNAITAYSNCMWFESAYTTPDTPATNGTIAIPVFFHATRDGGAWHTEADLRAEGIDPRKPPVSADKIYWPGTLKIIWNARANAHDTPPPPDTDSAVLNARMTIAPQNPDAYAAWKPAPGATQQFTASIQKQNTHPRTSAPAPAAARIHFRLTAAPDALRFAPRQSGLAIDPADQRHAWTTQPRSEATITIEALSATATGAIEAACDDLGLIAIDETTKLPYIAIPAATAGTTRVPATPAAATPTNSALPVFPSSEVNDFMRAYEAFMTDTIAAMKAAQKGDYTKLQKLEAHEKNLQGKNKILLGKLGPQDQARLVEFMGKQAQRLQDELQTAK